MVTQEKIQIRPARLSGTVQIVPSKSHLHRILICAAQGILKGDLQNLSLSIPRMASEDVDVTLDCIEALGVRVSRSSTEIHLQAGDKRSDVPVLHCRESGSSLRFLLPVAATQTAQFQMTGKGRLPKRPMGMFAQVLGEKGLTFTQAGEDFLPVHVAGCLASGVYTLPGDISSQYISGLLMALPALSGRSEIRLTTELHSAPYIEMTLSTLRDFGVLWQGSIQEGHFTIEGPASFKPTGCIEPEGDWSSGAFWVGAKALGADVCLRGLKDDSTQGDKAIVELCSKVGGDAVLDVQHVPDLVPILAVVCAFAKGNTTLTGTARLRLKESDRGQSVQEMIEHLGGRVT
ncbi:MAG: 3-phosphoshikimate 1-carboxyvinyltransferase, partial [Clostridia bacterium]|nr:3-phosphoshikimate 1-carboxyvinyltransferase [Clostridia bacterium]